MYELSNILLMFFLVLFCVMVCWLHFQCQLEKKWQLRILVRTPVAERDAKLAELCREAGVEFPTFIENQESKGKNEEVGE